MSLYLIRNPDGSETGPVNLEQLQQMVKDGKVRPNHMIFVQGASRWYLATALPEIRNLVRQCNPRHNRARLPLPKNTGETPRKKDGSPVKKGENRKNVPTEVYAVRTADGLEIQNLTFEEIKKMVQEERIKATTMVMTRTTGRWHLAASIQEVRRLLRKFAPGQQSVLNRLRSMGVHRGPNPDGAENAEDSMLKIKKSFWQRIFRPGK